ncbi:MAG: hypothetical protein ONB48_15675 [candidate division KSB1 bacterium]|nr:hypothetical protein [candidate division KSB1 bacterium]MDZ7276134.1 hypothetical protein [candidate division KSB1 bacterium]MDZ7287086.1 hypothetical protein [candidate division KSB1 bacterium]MDZ7296989.1 hypothetical protein [candidate division KSB1 bacterium]MDZ7306181.1 hypothetical protein [candidate division KSB1 bacterium]
MTLGSSNSLESRRPEMAIADASGPFAPPRAGVSLRDLGVLIYRRRKLALLVFAGIFLTVGAVTMMMPSVYVARARVMLKKERASTIISPNEAADTDTRPTISENMLNSEIEILKSTTLLRSVVTTEGLYKRLVQPEAVAILDSALVVELAVAAFSKTLECQVVPKSNIIEISCESEDPRLAAQLVNELCRQYVDRHLEVHESRGVYSFFQHQAQALQDTLQAIAAQLRQFEIENNLIAPEKQRELLLQKIADYEGQLNAVRAGAQAAERQVSFLEQQLANEPERIHARKQRASATVLEAMKRELAELQVKYDVLRQERAGSRGAAAPNSSLARSLQARIAQLEEAIQAEQQAAPPTAVAEISNTVLQLSSDLTRARMNLVGYRAQEEELQKAIAQQRTLLAGLERATLTHEALQRQLHLHENNYLLYAKKQEEARISEALDREKVANVSIIDPASVPLTAVRPNRKVNLALGLVLALVVSLGTALTAGYFDSLIRNRNDLERQLNVPVLVTIPEGDWPVNLLTEEGYDPRTEAAQRT